MDAKNEARFEQLLADNRRRLTGIARSFAAGPEAADLFQEMLLNIWKGLPGFAGRADPSTWVYRVALNTAMTWQRNRAVRQRHVETDDETARGAAVPAESARPGAELEMLRQFLAELNDVDRAIFVMFLDDLSYAQMAEVTGLSASNVGVKIHRIKKRFTARYVR